MAREADRAQELLLAWAEAPVPPDDPTAAELRRRRAERSGRTQPPADDPADGQPDPKHASHGIGPPQRSCATRHPS